MFVVFDLDGTMADLSHRLHLVSGEKQDWDTFYELCHEDSPIYEVIHVCRAMYAAGHWVEVWSGRAERCRDKTNAWLDAHSVPRHVLLLRPEEDFTPDTELKEQWLRNSLYGPPALVFDDRKRLAEMWRRNGVRCCHVAEGDY